MTPITLPTENCFVDTTQQVFQPTHIADGAVLGVIGFKVWFSTKNTSVASRSFTDRTISVSIDVSPKDGSIDSAEHMAKVEANSRRKAALENARKKYSTWLDNESIPGVGLASLRLAAGISQAELARRLNMAQPNVSRLERGAGDPHFSTIKSLATALNVSIDRVVSAIEDSMKSDNKVER